MLGARKGLTWPQWVWQAWTVRAGGTWAAKQVKRAAPHLHGDAGAAGRKGLPLVQHGLVLVELALPHLRARLAWRETGNQQHEPDAKMHLHHHGVRTTGAPRCCLVAQRATRTASSAHLSVLKHKDAGPVLEVRLPAPLVPRARGVVKHAVAAALALEEVALVPAPTHALDARNGSPTPAGGHRHSPCAQTPRRCFTTRGAVQWQARAFTC